MAWSAEIWTGAISCTPRTKMCKKVALHLHDAALLCFCGKMAGAVSDRSGYFKILCHLLHIGGGKLAQG